MKGVRVVMFILILSSVTLLKGEQIIIDNFDDYTWTTLYGKGEIAIFSDNDEAVPGTTVISKNFDSTYDHTTGSGYAVRVDYTIDSYGGIYFVFTSDPAVYSYINGYEYKQLSFYLMAENTTYDWRMELKDYNGQSCNLSLGKISTEWGKFEFDIDTLANMYNNVNFSNLNTLVLLNTNSGSSGKIYIDDIKFDNMAYIDTDTSSGNSVSFSAYKITTDNQSIRIKVQPENDSKISIKIANKGGENIKVINTGDFYYSGGGDAVFEWAGTDNNDNQLRNGIYFVVVKITDKNNKETKIIKPIIIVR